jgi:hypothetical protein
LFYCSRFRSQNRKNLSAADKKSNGYAGCRLARGSASEKSSRVVLLQPLLPAQSLVKMASLALAR